MAGKAKIKGKKTVQKFDPILKRKVVKKEDDWSDLANLSPDSSDDNIHISELEQFDTKFHSMIFVKMLMEEIPRKPTSFPKYMNPFKIEAVIELEEGPQKMIPTK